MPKTYAAIAAPLVAIGLALAACTPTMPVSSSGVEDTTQASEAAFATFTDIPMPGGMEMDLERTLILGSQESWIGRLVLNTTNPANEMFDFYQREMLNFGWSEITTVRAEVSVLTYARGDRVATLQIHRGSLRGTTVDITVSPRAMALPQ